MFVMDIGFRVRAIFWLHYRPHIGSWPLGPAEILTVAHVGACIHNFLVSCLLLSLLFIVVTGL